MAFLKVALDSIRTRCLSMTLTLYARERE